ncbi:hypothetical protein FRC09_005803 [Ceratobasidium sp. 395]|nr:hypothetical protein FRC09_005803 [Ceratobasidium sp. 395]
MDSGDEEITSKTTNFQLHSSRRAYGTLNDRYFVKYLWHNPDLLDSAQVLEKELDMMILAGDCSVKPLGRVFKDGKLTGLVLSLERPITVSSNCGSTFLLPSETSKRERLNRIDELCSLVDRLHAKSLIHGDIKPSNLLRCSDGSLRFCDFAEAFVVCQSASPRATTTQYSSPFMLKGWPRPVITQTEDLYATGISIWEIYTGRVPFGHIEDDWDVEDVIRDGGRPDMSLVDDPTVLTLVARYLDSGDRSLRQDDSKATV